jgi:AcrR family transcriptional regulator
VPGEDFSAFQIELARFNLEPLLPNPQFLKLFADAYIESERHFTDKRSIFAQAVERLAKEVNPNIVTTKSMLSTARKVNISSAVFTRLLLAGAEGVCTSETNENRMYPLLSSLFDGDKEVDGILATRLFKPGDNADQHRPVHKIIAEYCAADYLTNRIKDPADHLTLSKCLTIVAPNSTVRNELRGLLGWMAALGNKPIQKSAIELDPYAVLANGDPSQLEHSSKRLLVNRLKQIEKQDPYFRRGDFYRRFSVAGFFTHEVVDEIKPFLLAGSEGHLCDLILELLVGSQAAEQLREELRQLTVMPTVKKSTRLLANRCLLQTASYGHYSTLAVLISEASITSLCIAADTFETLGLETFERTYLEDFFRACAKLYPGHKERYERGIGDHYFVMKLINGLDFATTEGLLNVLTKDLSCICGKKPYECDCRNGISKIIGSMLDRYFELVKPPYDPLQVWKWIGNLNFHNRKGTGQSKAVQVLQKDDDLRQGIIAHVFGKLTDCNEILEVRNKFNLYSHSGLTFRADDYEFVVNLAFEVDNPDLWAGFIAVHKYYRNKEELGPDALRRRMREQALEKSAFMRKWAIAGRTTAKQFVRNNHIWGLGRNRKIERHRRKQDEIRTANIKYVKDHRELIESGRNWNYLVRFAEIVLISPEKIEHEFGDETLVRNALRNCLDFIAPHVPNLLELAKLQCVSKGSLSEMILYAACLEIIRVNGTLEGVDPRLLRALRTNIHMGYSAVTQRERESLMVEVDRLIFTDEKSVENFLRQYLEPQLAQSGCNHPELWLLRNENIFNSLRASLSIEWLQRFRGLALDSLDTLFEIAAEYGNRDDLKKIITTHCAEFITDSPNPTQSYDNKEKRIFWLVRAWYFLDDVSEVYWDSLKTDKEIVLILDERSGRMSRNDHHYWPKLTSSKIEAILNAFINKWPKVDLPNSWGSESPNEEKAYRFLTDVIWSIDSDDPNDAIPVLGRLLVDPRFADLHNDLKSIHFNQVKKQALRDFSPPTPVAIVKLLDRNAVVTVEGLRQQVIEELQEFQKDIDGGEFNTVNRFYENGRRIDEERSTLIIAERLKLRLEVQDISVTLEHQLKSANRSDFTVTKMIDGKRRLLVTEVKGQWHNELYTAANNQLYERYSIHPDAEQQGIFLAIWFGEDELVAGKKGHGIGSALELKSTIETRLPPEIVGLIDVFILDVSKPHTNKQIAHKQM